MAHVIFEGSAAAIVTPMDSRQRVDYQAFGRILEYQIEGGTDAILVNGTTGESATQEGLVRHFTAVADQVDLPIRLYSVPSRTGMKIEPETYKRLSEHPNIVGTKEAGGNISLTAKTAALCGEDFSIYSGNDDQTVAIMALGGKGVISVLANIMPAQVHKMCRLYREGRIKESREEQLRLLEIMEAMFQDVNPIPVKAALSIMGFCGESCRLPLTPMEAEKRKTLEEVMRRYGLAAH